MTFCEGVKTPEDCVSCPKNDTQHPCWYAKCQHWKKDPIALSETATPTRKKTYAPGEVPPPPKGASDETKAFDHAIPKDERGLPYLTGKTLEPATAKELRNYGTKKMEKKLKEYASKTIR